MASRETKRFFGPASAATVLGPADDEAPRVYEGVQFQHLRDRDSGRVIQNLELRHCSFGAGCSLSFGGDHKKRTVIRRVRLTGCNVPSKFGMIGAPVLDEVSIDGLRSGAIMIVGGAAFRHVVLQGNIAPMNLNEVAAFPSEPAAVTRAREFRAANREFYRQVDWALDIRQAKLASLRLASIPGHLVLRDPETQVLVSRARLIEGQWTKLRLPAITRIALEDFLSDTSEDHFETRVIVAGKRSKSFVQALQGLELLRREGFTIE